MANFITRAGALGPYVNATYQTIPTVARNAGAVLVVAKDKPVIHSPGRQNCTQESWARNALTSSVIVKSGIGSKYLIVSSIVYRLNSFKLTFNTESLECINHAWKLDFTFVYLCFMFN